MKYESNILKRLIDTYGVVGNPRYISEIIKEFIVQGKERFPNLFTYQADWLAHIDEFGLNPSYTVSYTGQSIYAPNTLEKPVKSAILKGSTKYRDIDTGEILETFEEGRNLELVSVKMPVLTTKTGINLLNPNLEPEIVSSLDMLHTKYIKASFGDKFSISTEISARWWNSLYIYDSNKNLIVEKYGDSDTSPRTIILDNPSIKDVAYVRFGYAKHGDISKTMLNYGEQLEFMTYNGDYKSNILTVNEDVTLRSNGDICDELNLLTGQLTQRIGEDGVVLSQEVVKTVDLSILDQNGENVKQLMSFNSGTHFNTGSAEGSPLPVLSVSVETDLEETLRVCSLEGNTM